MKLNIKKAKMNDRLLARKHSKSVSDPNINENDDFMESSEDNQKVSKKTSPFEKKAKMPTKVTSKKEPAKIIKHAEEQDEDLDDMHGFIDAFVVETDAFDPTFVYSVELPKMIFKTSSSDTRLVKEKSSIMISLVSAPETIGDGLFKTLMLATKKNKISFSIKWLGIPDGNVVSTWKFNNPRIAAIDLGTCTYEEREEPTLILVELEYDNINFDGVEV